MTSGWCGKIANTFYDIFNGWSVDQLTKSYSKSINGINNNNNNNNNNRNDTDNNNNINNNINDRNNYLNRKPLERSESLWSWAGTGFNNYGYTRECRQQFSSQIESACTCHDTLFICDHQRNQLGISTTSNTSLNIPYYRCPPLGFQQPCQQQQQQQQQYRNQVLAPALNRSYSLDLPPSSYNNYNNNNNNNTFYQPFPNIIPINSQQPSTDLNDQRLPTMGITRQINKPIYSSNEQQQQQRDSITKNTNNPKLCQKLSARSSCSIPGDYDNTSEQQIQNNEEIIRSTVKNLVSRSSPYPMIYIPLGNTDYRVEGGYSNDSSLWSIVNTVSSADCQIDCDNISQIYNNDFYEQYHLNLYAIDKDLNPVVMSVKLNGVHNSRSVIVRTKESSKYAELSENNSDNLDYSSYCNQLYPNVKVDHFETCSSLKAAQFVKAYDEKLETQKFKFGVIYQRRGQTTEEEFFNNERHGRALDEFLDKIATRVSLRDFKGFRAGLDTSGKTDTPISYYELYENKEIMFHVSTLLPFTCTDRQQVQRKRHIGNDIVAIVFQEENTPFHPSMIRSNFLHAFLVVQPVYNASRTCYKIMLVTRRDVESFNPVLHENCVYLKSSDFLKPFILTKLINAEYACYRCRTFSLLQERTRCAYLKTLCEHLTTKTYDILCDEQKSSQRRASLLSNSTKRRYFSSMKKMFGRSNSTPDGRISTSDTSTRTFINTLNNESEINGKDRRKNSKKLSRTSNIIESLDETTILGPLRSSMILSEGQDLTNEKNLINRTLTGLSFESLNSTDTPSDHRPQMYYEESDEGLDSMSSAETHISPSHPVLYDNDQHQDPDVYRQQLRQAEKKNDAYIKPVVYNSWHHPKSSMKIFMPQTTGIHISEEAAIV